MAAIVATTTAQPSLFKIQRMMRRRSAVEPVIGHANDETRTCNRRTRLRISQGLRPSREERPSGAEIAHKSRYALRFEADPLVDDSQH
jgi:hypothetical protein